MVNSQEDVLVSYASKRILITGGAGYLSSRLVQRLSAVPCHIIRLYRQGGTVPPAIPNAKAQIENMQGDVRACQIWSGILDGIDFVFHFAAQTSVYVANQNPLADLDMNVLPMLHLLETCRQKRCAPVVLFAGTVTETGISERLPVDETHPDKPVTVYDLHKFIAEGYLQHYAREGIVRGGATLRLSNVYGPGQPSSNADRGVLNEMIRRAVRGCTLTVYGDGTHMRDYIFIDDVVSAFLIAGAQIEKLNGNYYIIGSGVGHRIIEAVNLVADRVVAQTGRRPEVVHVSPPGPQSPIEVRNFVADITRFRIATGWSPQVPLGQGVDHTIDYFFNELQESQR